MTQFNLLEQKETFEIVFLILKDFFRQKKIIGYKLKKNGFLKWICWFMLTGLIMCDVNLIQFYLCSGINSTEDNF